MSGRRVGDVGIITRWGGSNARLVAAVRGTDCRWPAVILIYLRAYLCNWDDWNSGIQSVGCVVWVDGARSGKKARGGRLRLDGIDRTLHRVSTIPNQRLFPSPQSPFPAFSLHKFLMTHVTQIYHFFVLFGDLFLPAHPLLSCTESLVGLTCFPHFVRTT